MIETLIYVILVLIIAGVIFWAIQQLLPLVPMPEPFHRIIHVLMVVVLVIIVVYVIAQLLGVLPRGARIGGDFRGTIASHAAASLGGRASAAVSSSTAADL